MNIRTAYRRSNWYDGLRLLPDHDNIISQRDGEKHTESRAKMAAGVSVEFELPIHANIAISIRGRKTRT